jgi:hypothetical protein
VEILPRLQTVLEFVVAIFASQDESSHVAAADLAGLLSVVIVDGDANITGLPFFIFVTSCLFSDIIINNVLQRSLAAGLAVDVRHASSDHPFTLFSRRPFRLSPPPPPRWNSFCTPRVGCSPITRHLQPSSLRRGCHPMFGGDRYANCASSAAL